MPALHVGLAARWRVVGQYQEHWRTSNMSTSRSLSSEHVALNNLNINQSVMLLDILQQRVYRQRWLASVKELQHLIITEWGKLSDSLTVPSVSGIGCPTYILNVI